MVHKLDDAVSGEGLRVLLVDDEPLIAEQVREELERHGYTVSLAESLEDGLRAALVGDTAIVILDRMLNGLDGLAMIEAMREKGIATPVMILSGLTSIDERIRGLRAGGDDYLVKPFAMGELLARIEVLLRRGGDARSTRLRRPLGARPRRAYGAAERPADRFASARIQNPRIFHAPSQSGDRARSVAQGHLESRYLAPDQCGGCSSQQSAPQNPC
jgi:DNA-binding response OmpR family regulator